MKTPTEFQTKHREALTPSHFDVLRDTISRGYNYDSIGTDARLHYKHLVELEYAGFLYSWQGVFYATDAGKAAIEQPAAEKGAAGALDVRLFGIKPEHIEGKITLSGNLLKSWDD